MKYIATLAITAILVSIGIIMTPTDETKKTGPVTLVQSTNNNTNTTQTENLSPAQMRLRELGYTGWAKVSAK